jgi:hypothetical protein
MSSVLLRRRGPFSVKAREAMTADAEGQEGAGAGELADEAEEERARERLPCSVYEWVATSA